MKTRIPKSYGLAIKLLIAGLNVGIPAPTLAAPISLPTDAEDRLLETFDNMTNEAIELKTRASPESFARVFDYFVGQYIEGHDMADFTDEQLDTLHTLFVYYLFYTNDPPAALKLTRITDELDRRLLATSDQFSTTYEYLVESRQTREAWRFSQRHHGKFVPELIEWTYDDRFKDGMPAIARVSNSNGIRTLTVSPLDLESGTHIVVVTHPGCLPSRNFMQYLEQDSALLKAFSGRTTWIVRQGETIPTENISNWNLASEHIDLGLSYLDQDWPQEITFATSPTFYFFKDGEVVHETMGWTGIQDLEKLEKGLDLLGSE